ncbi:MAG: serine hydrolase, partial [Bacillota bacterium]|nr:serine hydrolase [Bacillota bacterium]
MSKQLVEANLQQAVRNMLNSKHVHGAILRMENGPGDLVWEGSAGDLQTKDRYFIASVTKLFMSAVIFGLVDEGRLKLDDRIVTFFPEGMLL